MIIIKILALIGTFFFMEFMAWFTHKYIMHGPLWVLHEDHHNQHKGFFQRNDAFFLIFAVPSWLLIMFGMMNGNDIRLWIGAGIAVYGVTYFLVHDIFIHQRFKWFKKSDHPYFRAIRKAHKVHHKTLGKHDSECFGMLVVPFKFYKQARDIYRQEKRQAHNA